MQIIMAYVDDLGGDDSQWMFPNFKKGKQNSVVLINTHVSYNNMLKLLRQGLDQIGVKGTWYSLHSIRTGGQVIYA